MEVFKEIEISKIKSLENIRTKIKDKDIRDLMNNIKQQGLLQPIGVWLTPNKKEHIIAFGNRRLASCDKLGWKTITAKILGELSYEDMLIVNTSENLHRKEVTVQELGRICKLLETKGLSKGEIAVRLGLPTQRIAVALRIFEKIPREFRNDVMYLNSSTRYKEGKIPAHVFNTLYTLGKEFGIGQKDLRKVLNSVKKYDLSIGQIQLFGVLLREGMSIDKALGSLHLYNIRRISVPIKKTVEEGMLKKHGIQFVTELFSRILNGEIQGNDELVYANFKK